MPRMTLPTVARSSFVTASTRSLIPRFVPLLAVSVLALSACAGPALSSGADEPPLDSGPGSGVEETPGDPMPIPIEGINGNWVFADGTDGAGELLTDVTITLVITDTTISGQSACNSYSAALTGKPTDLTIGAVASTKRACENALMEFDSRYFSALELVTVGIPTGGSIVLQGDGVTMNFLPTNSLPEG